MNFKTFLVLCAVLIPIIGIGFVLRNIIRSSKKKIWLWMKSVIATAGLLFLGCVFMILAIFYLPPYTPGPNLFLVRNQFDDEIIEVYGLMTRHTQELGVNDKYHNYYLDGDPDGWSEEAYDKAVALVGQLRSRDGPAIYFVDILFTTLGDGQSMMRLDVDTHEDHVVYLVFAPGSTNDRFVQLDDTGDWFYWDYCK